MELLLPLLSALTGSGLCSLAIALLQRRWAARDRRDTRVDALVAANKVLLIDKVRFLAKKYIALGQIHLEDKENLLEMYRAYKDLGGNGHLDTVMGEIHNLKVI